MVGLLGIEITSLEKRDWSRGYFFFMLNSAEHEIFSVNKYENANKSWHFHIYEQRNFHAQLLVC